MVRPLPHLLCSPHSQHPPLRDGGVIMLSDGSHQLLREDISARRVKEGIARLVPLSSVPASGCTA